jgi:hypothetical protein
MAEPDDALSVENISSLIHLIRDQRIILDTDLARLYGMQTFRLNEAVIRSVEALTAADLAEGMKRPRGSPPAPPPDWFQPPPQA